MKDYNAENNRAVWFDIPVANLDRAQKFYETVLNIKIFRDKFNDFEFCVLDHEKGNGGCLMMSPNEISADKGIMVYMNVDGRIQDAMSKVEPGGGKILESTHQIGQHGFRSVILDSEGNRIALHSNTDA